MHSLTILVASALAALAGAQSVTSSISSSSVTVTSGSATSLVTSTTVATTSAAGPVSQTQSMPAIATAGFNPNNVTSAEKANWCRAQRNSCPAICGGGPSVNQCDDVLLTYSCTCYNGTIPDVTRYTQTLPFFICEATRAQCIASRPDDSAGQDTCENNAQCGTITPPNIEPATTTTSSSGNGNGSPTGNSAGTTTSSPTPTNAAVIYQAELTTGAFAALLIAVYNFLL